MHTSDRHIVHQSLSGNAEVFGELPVGAEATRDAILAAETGNRSLLQNPATLEKPAAIVQAQEIESLNLESMATGINLPDHFEIMWYADISPDGRELVYVSRGELQRISLDGTTIDKLPIRVPKDARPLSMSPDGETILYRQITSGTQCWSIDVRHLVNQ